MPTCNQRGILGAALCLALVTVTAHGTLFPPDGSVTTLDKSNFQTIVLDATVPAIVQFSNNDCPQCAQLAKQMTAVGEKLADLMTVGAVNCDDAGSSKICEAAGVRSLPSVMVYPADNSLNPYTKQLYKTPTAYNGPADARSISLAARAALVDTFITQVRSGPDWDAFEASAGPLPQVVLFTDKADSTALYRSLSIHFRGLFHFAEVSTSPSQAGVAPSVDSVLDTFGVDTTQLPALFVVKPDGTHTQYADLHRKPNVIELSDWLRELAPPDVEGALEKGHAEGQERERAASSLPVVGWSELDELCEEEDLVLVALLPPPAPDTTPQCAARREELAALAAGMQGMFGLVTLTLRPDDAPRLEAFGVPPDGLLPSQPDCAPHLMLLPYGDDVSLPDDVEHYPRGAALTPKAVQAFVYPQLPTLTLRVTDATVARFTGGAPGGVHPFTLKVLLFTDKTEAPGMYNALAVNMRHRDYAFGWAGPGPDAAGLREQFRVDSTPFMVLIWVDPDAQPDATGQVEMNVQPYQAPLKYSLMATFFEVMYKQLRGDRDPQGDDAARFGAPPPVLEATGAASFDKHCGELGGLCVMGVFDATSPDVDANVAVLEGVANRRRGVPLHFLWLDGPGQPAVMEAYGVQPHSVPTLVAVNPKKLRYAVLSRPLSEAAVDDLLDGLLSGRVGTHGLPQLPGVVDGGVPRPAEAAEEAEVEVEEEFDLSDVMGEEVGGGLKSRDELMRDAEAQIEADAAEQARQDEAEAAGRKPKSKTKKKRKRKKGTEAGHNEL